MLKGILGTLWSFAIFVAGIFTGVIGMVNLLDICWPNTYDHIKASKRNNGFTWFIRNFGR